MSDDTTYIQLMQYTAGTSFMFLLWLCAYFSGTEAVTDSAKSQVGSCSYGSYSRSRIWH